MIPSAKIPWLPWSAESFAAARSESKPVLLSLVTRWSGLCRLLDRTTFSDPEVVTRISETVIPIRVDADERPDILDRYHLGGWPTTAFLSGHGVLLAGATFIEAEEMRRMLHQLPPRYRAQFGEMERSARERDERIRRAEEGGGAGGRLTMSPGVVERTREGILRTVDPAQGGFGASPKFPFADSLLFLLEDLRVSERGFLSRTLHSIVERELHDRSEGGFFRCCIRADWSGAVFEKLAEENAAILEVLLRGGDLLPEVLRRETPDRTISFLMDRMRDPATGAFGLAQISDEEYYALPPEARGGRSHPEIDSRVFAPVQARVGSVLLRAGGELSRTDLREAALRCLREITLDRPFLRDAVLSARSFLDAFDATADGFWRERAVGAMEGAMRSFHSEVGGLRDRAEQPDDVGDLARVIHPLPENGIAIDNLLRLAGATGEDRHREEAGRLLESLPDPGARFGHGTVEVARAVRRVLRSPGA